MPKKLSKALTPLQVKNAKPGRHADGEGLHLLVKRSGAQSWVYRFMLNGKSPRYRAIALSQRLSHFCRRLEAKLNPGPSTRCGVDLSNEGQTGVSTH